MMARNGIPALCVVALMLFAGPLMACDLCRLPGGDSSPPFSHDLAQSKFVVFGSIVSVKFNADMFTGTSELKVEAVIKSDGKIKEQQILTLSRPVPPDPEKRQKFVVFFAEVNGKLDPYLGVPVTSDTIVKYLKEIPAVDPQAKPSDKAARLLYYFKHLDSAEPLVANDAYKQFHFASNLEVGLVASRFPPAKLREWLADPKTPLHRLGLYSYLLGACGNERDADFLRRLILNPDERMSGAVDGLLAGYIQLRPQDGWKLTHELLGNKKRGFVEQHALVRMLRFYYGYQPDTTRPHALKGMEALLGHPDMVDIAIDQLRQWKLWDLTDMVLVLFGTEQASAPITQRAIVRYALTCPMPKAKRFVEELRKKDPELVSDVEEGLRGI